MTNELHTWVVTFFFFQAEDGIRDLTVTGVQTCALPISTAQQPDGGDSLRRHQRAARDGRATDAVAPVRQREDPAAHVDRARRRRRGRSGDVVVAGGSPPGAAPRPTLRRRKRRARTSDRARQAGDGKRALGGREALGDRTLDARGQRIGRGIRRIDLVLVTLLNHTPLYLQRRRQLTRLDRKVILEQQDLLRRLELGEIAQRAHHLALHLRLYVRELQQLRARSVAQAPLGRPALEVVEVRHDQNDRELAAVAIQHRVGDERVALDHTLDRLRRNVFSHRRLWEGLLSGGGFFLRLSIEVPAVSRAPPPRPLHCFVRPLPPPVVAPPVVW